MFLLPTYPRTPRQVEPHACFPFNSSTWTESSLDFRDVCDLFKQQLGGHRERGLALPVPPPPPGADHASPSLQPHTTDRLHLLRLEPLGVDLLRATIEMIRGKSPTSPTATQRTPSPTPPMPSSRTTASSRLCSPSSRTSTTSTSSGMCCLML